VAVILHRAAWRGFALCFLTARNSNTAALRAGKTGAGAPVLSAGMRMATISRPGSASAFSLPVFTARRIKIRFNSNSNSNSNSMAPFGSPASRVVEPHSANRQRREAPPEREGSRSVPDG